MGGKQGIQIALGVVVVALATVASAKRFECREAIPNGWRCSCTKLSLLPDPTPTPSPSPSAPGDCPPGWQPVTEPGPSNPHEFIAGGDVANGETMHFCALLKDPSASVVIIKTVDRSGLAQCTHVLLEVDGPGICGEPTEFNNNTMGCTEARVGAYLIKVTGKEPFDSACSSNRFLLAWQYR